MGQGKGLTYVRSRGGNLSVDDFDPILPVIQDGNGKRDAVQGIEAARRIANGLPLAGECGLPLIPFQISLAEVAEGNDERIFPDRDKEVLLIEGLHNALHGRAALGDAGIGPAEFSLVGEIILAVLQQGLVVLRLSAFAIQLGETQLQQILTWPESDGTHRRVRSQGFKCLLAKGLRFGNLRREAVGDVVAQRRLSRIAAGDLLFQAFVDFVLLRLLEGQLTASEQVPQDIFAVVQNEFLERAGEIGSQVAVELRMLAPGESVQGTLDIFPALFRGLAGEFTHPGVGHDGLVETFHQTLEFRPEGVVELPIASPFRLDVLLAGIVEVSWQVPVHRFVADALQDLGFLLGTVGIMHLFVFRPLGGEDMSVRVHSSRFIGILALRQQIARAGEGDDGRNQERKEEGGLPFHSVSKYVMASLTTKVLPPM